MERLSNPPIIEAILIIEHGAPHAVEPHALDAFFGAIQDRYPQRDTQLIPPYFSTAGRGPASDADVYSTSHLFSASDEPHVVQISAMGFMFHRVRQYSTFEPFVNEARRIWGIYASLFDSGPISRLSLRYINDISLPIDSLQDLAQFLRIRPEVPGSLAGDELQNVLLRIGLREDSIPAYGIITQTFELLDGGGEISLILDMEATSKEPPLSKSGDMWAVFEQLRQLKNRLFRESITDRTERLFR